MVINDVIVDVVFIRVAIVRPRKNMSIKVALI